MNISLYNSGRLSLSVAPNISTYPNGWTSLEQIKYQETGQNTPWTNSSIYDHLMNAVDSNGVYKYRPTWLNDYFKSAPVEWKVEANNKAFASATDNQFSNPSVGTVSDFWSGYGTLYSKGISTEGNPSTSTGAQTFMLPPDGDLVLNNPQTDASTNASIDVLNHTSISAVVNYKIIFTNPKTGYVLGFFNGDLGTVQHEDELYLSKGLYFWVLGIKWNNSTSKWEHYLFKNIPNRFNYQGQQSVYMSGYGYQPPSVFSVGLCNYTLSTRLDKTYVGLKVYTRLLSNEYDSDYLPPLYVNCNAGIIVCLSDNNLSEGDSDDPNNPPLVNTNPFDDPIGGESTTTGDRDNSSDNIEVGGNNTLPDNVNSPLQISGGLFTVYNLTASEMSALGTKLWSSTVIDDIKNSLYKPLENIIACYYTNVPIPNDIQTSTYVKIAGYDFNNEVTANKLNGNWVNLDCGNLNVKEYFASCLDYAPYCNVSLYLPFVGIIPLDTDQVIASTLNVRYNIDLITGDCVAHVSSNKNVHGITYQGIIGSFDGNLYASIPITASNTWASRNIVGAGNLISGLLGKNPIGGVQNALNTVTTKPSYQKSGNISGCNGMMSYKYPYLIIERPIDYIPQKYYSFVGLNSYVYKSLSDVKGWFRCENPIINFNSSTSEQTPLGEEVAEIKQLLSSGVRIN